MVQILKLCINQQIHKKKSVALIKIFINLYFKNHKLMNLLVFDYKKKE